MKNTKICNKCNKEKILLEFYFRKDNNTYRNECKDCIKEAKALRESKPGVKELRALKEKERRKNHKDKINKRLREQRNTPEGKERIKANYKRMKEKHPEKIQAWKRASRHKRRESKSHINAATFKEVTQWLLEQPKKCSYCWRDCHKDYQLDHIVPLSKGGTHTIDNFTIACPTCNNSKHNHSLIIWIAKKKLAEVKDKKL